MNIDLFHVPAGDKIDLNDSNFQRDKNVTHVFTIESSLFGCHHDKKASSIFGPYVKNESSLTKPFSLPRFLLSTAFGPSDAVIIDTKVCHADSGNYVSLEHFVLFRGNYTGVSRFYFVGDRHSPSYSVFLLYSHPVQSFLVDGDGCAEVTREAMKIISARHALSDCVPRYRKLGIIVDNMTSVSRNIITSLKKLANFHGMKLYFFSISSIADYKLGNFMEIEAFVTLKCVFCHEWNNRYMRPVMTVFEFLAGLFGCFWEQQYGDISSLISKCDVKQILSSSNHLIEFHCSDFKETFSCNSSFNGKCEEGSSIEEGNFGTPRSYKQFLDHD